MDALVFDADDLGVGQDISYFLTRCNRQRFDELTGFDDWANQKYDFRHSIRYADGVARQRPLDGPTSEDADQRGEVRNPRDVNRYTKTCRMVRGRIAVGVGRSATKEEEAHPTPARPPPTHETPRTCALTLMNRG